MAEEVAKKVEEPAVAAEPALASGPPPAAAAANDVVEEKAVVPLPPGKALVVAEKAPDAVQKSSKGSLDRDVALAQVETEKRLSFIKAWEESEKTKAENKAQKKLADVLSWENSKKAAVEANLKKIEGGMVASSETQLFGSSEEINFGQQPSSQAT